MKVADLLEGLSMGQQVLAVGAYLDDCIDEVTALPEDIELYEELAARLFKEGFTFSADVGRFDKEPYHIYLPARNRNSVRKKNRPPHHINFTHYQPPEGNLPWPDNEPVTSTYKLVPIRKVLSQDIRHWLAHDSYPGNTNAA